MNKLVLASGNPSKISEMRALLEDLPLTLIAQSELGVQEIPETGFTFVENALIKARHAARASGLPALADDSGLIVDALEGAPGLRSSRYAGEKADAQANISKLLNALRDVSSERRTARFYSVIVLLRHARDPAPLVCQGTWEGYIADSPRGTHGFCYDAVFIDPGLKQTAAEIDSGTKNLLSHRGRAMAQLRANLGLERK